MDSMNERILNSRILIVDDKPANVALLEFMLEKEGYANVSSTLDSRQVVPMMEADPFDLILLDIRMPFMDGIEVMQAMAGIIKNDYLPILVLTAQTDFETRKQALSAGARDFLTKPFQDWEVCLRIRNMLETRAYFNGQKVRANELEGLVDERTREILETQLEIIRRLGRAGEYRDNETGAHIIRMSKMSRQLALAAGYSQEFANKILYASPMHDVGKIGVPDRVLLKPGKHTPDEWEIMKLHVTIGSDIVGDHPSELIQMAKVIAETHHEKWDGSGYPNGLSGEDIPLESRIVMICDVFDALTSKRPYKEPWPTERAIDLINSEAGKHFDPDLVEFFRGIVDEFLVIKDEYPDIEEPPTYLYDQAAAGA